MFRRTVCLILSAVLMLSCLGTAFADSDQSVSVAEFTTYTAADSPTAIPTATPVPTHPATTATPTHPAATATAAPTATATAAPTATVSPVLLTNGSRGEDVRKVQQYLIRMGFTTGSADGIYGNVTTVAVDALQSYLVMLNTNGRFSYTRTCSYGDVDGNLLSLINSNSIPVYYTTVKSGATSSQIRRVQTRLASLDYMVSTVIDGVYGVTTSSAISDFQKTNGLTVTGEADEATQKVLFSSSAKKCTNPSVRYPYKLVVDVSEQRVYVYQYSNGSYSKLKARFVCSTGKVATPTPIGTYRSTEQLDVWHYFVDYGCWAQYAYRITGTYYFHSVLFSKKGGSPTSSSVRNLGRRASHGCVRLSVEDAKWIYYNCPAGTTVVVQN